MLICTLEIKVSDAHDTSTIIFYFHVWNTPYFVDWSSDRAGFTANDASMKEKCTRSFAIRYFFQHNRNMPTILNRTLARKRIKIAEHRVGSKRRNGRRREQRAAKEKSEIRASRVEHYIMPLSTGSFRLSIHWQSSSSGGRPPRKDDEGTRVPRRKSLPSFRRERPPSFPSPRESRICVASLRTDCAELLINSLQSSLPLHEQLILNLPKQMRQQT